MSLGPSLIFDKSALQALSVDESMWLESFYLTNITPLFFVETLGDLEKEVREGRTPEQVVGNLADKTPDMSSANVHHRSLIAGELLREQVVEMSGRPIISGGQTVELEGKTGVIFMESPESEAVHRWSKGEFLELERGIAKKWRNELALMQKEDYSEFEKFFLPSGKPKDLQELKDHIDFLISRMSNRVLFEFALTVVGISEEAKVQILERWIKEGSKPIVEFAPYFAYVLSVDLFFYIGTAAGLLKQFPHSQTHKVDLAYLYYLPFCKIFVSNDKFHIGLAPIFMQKDQIFISGVDFKGDLSKLNAYYDALSDEVKDRGVVSFAPCPPDDVAFLATRLWDKYMSTSWREMNNHTRKFDGTDKIDNESEKAIGDLIRKFIKESKPVGDNALSNSDKADSIVIKRMVASRKGKWEKFPPVIRNSKPIFED